MTTRKSKTTAPKASAAKTTKTATKTAKKTTANKKATARKKPQARVRKPKATPAPAPSYDEISARAYEIFEQSGYQHGRDEQHWLQAERELLAERQASPRP